jgi:hypothetical protein
VGEGIEPPSSGYRPDALPLSYPTRDLNWCRPSGSNGALLLFGQARRPSTPERPVLFRHRGLLGTRLSLVGGDAEVRFTFQTAARIFADPCSVTRVAVSRDAPGRMPVSALRPGRKSPFADRLFLVALRVIKNPIERVACGGLDGVLTSGPGAADYITRAPTEPLAGSISVLWSRPLPSWNSPWNIALGAHAGEIADTRKPTANAACSVAKTCLDVCSINMVRLVCLSKVIGYRTTPAGAAK